MNNFVKGLFECRSACWKENVFPLNKHMLQRSDVPTNVMFRHVSLGWHVPEGSLWQWLCTSQALCTSCCDDVCCGKVLLSWFKSIFIITIQLRKLFFFSRSSKSDEILSTQQMSQRKLSRKTSKKKMFPERKVMNVGYYAAIKLKWMSPFNMKLNGLLSAVAWWHCLKWLLAAAHSLTWNSLVFSHPRRQMLPHVGCV